MQDLHANDEYGDVHQHEPLFGELHVVFVFHVRQRVHSFEVGASKGLNGWTVTFRVRAGTSSVFELRGDDALNCVRDRVDVISPLPVDWNLRERQVQAAKEEADGYDGRRTGLSSLDGRAEACNDLTKRHERHGNSKDHENVEDVVLEGWH